MSLLCPSISFSVLKFPSLCPSAPSAHPNSRIVFTVAMFLRFLISPCWIQLISFIFIPLLPFFCFPSHGYWELLQSRTLKPSRAPLPSTISAYHIPFFTHSWHYRNSHSIDLINYEWIRLALWVQFSNMRTHKALMLFCCVLTVYMQ